MRKIQYGERAVRAVLACLDSETDIRYDMDVEAITIDATKENADRIFSRINAIISPTKYMVQKEITSITITVFNGSV